MLTLIQPISQGMLTRTHIHVHNKYRQRSLWHPEYDAVLQQVDVLPVTEDTLLPERFGSFPSVAL